MASTLTPFGRELRKLRVDTGERIFDLGQALGYTSSFISAVELGKKQVPAEFTDKVIGHYKLRGADKDRLKKAAEQSGMTVKISLKDTSDLSRDLAAAFARAFPTIDAEKAKQLLTVLDEDKKR